MKNGSTYVKAEQTVSVNNASGTMTFTPKGKQVVWAITLTAVKATEVGAVNDVQSRKSDAVYNIAGQRVNSSYNGFVIKNGKKYVKTVK